MFKILKQNLYVGFVDSLVTTEVKQMYELALKNKLVDGTITGTINGTQTSNIVSLFAKSHTAEILNTYTSEYLKNYYSLNNISRLAEFTFEIHHLHVIKYNNGYQVKHNHSWNEDHSFLLYLNDSIGSTRFYNDVTPYDVEPEANKIVFFNSAIEHEGLYTENKFVLVGGIRVHKDWR